MASGWGWARRLLWIAPISTSLARLIDRYEPGLVSEHLCWGAAGGRHLNDLLPLPYTEEALAHVCGRIEQVQTHLGRQILIENVSSYLQFRHSTIPEWEFLAEVAARSGCAILLDVNNIHVSAVNHRFDALAYLAAIPAAAVQEIHLAGFDASGPCLIDTHGTAVADQVSDPVPGSYCTSWGPADVDRVGHRHPAAGRIARRGRKGDADPRARACCRCLTCRPPSRVP